MSNRLFLSSLRGVRRLANANDDTRQQAGRMRSAAADDEVPQTAEEVVMGDAATGGGDDDNKNKGSAGVVRKGRGHGGERALLEGPVFSLSARRKRRSARADDDDDDVAMGDNSGFGNRRGSVAVDDSALIDPYHSRSGKDVWRHDMYTGPMSAGSWVFVRNCPSTVTPQQLYHLFQTTVNSPVVTVKVHRGSIPTALIGFVRRDAAETAESKLHGRDVDGTVLKVCKVDESVAEIEEVEEGEDSGQYSRTPQRARSSSSSSSFRTPRRGGGGWSSRSGPGQVRRTPFKRRSSGGRYRGDNNIVLKTNRSGGRSR